MITLDRPPSPPLPAGSPTTRPAGRPVAATAPLMGGLVSVHLLDPDADGTDLEASGRQVLRRIAAWAGRLTRFAETSELCRLNADPRDVVPVSATMTAVLDWARIAEGLTDGLVDVAMLDARLAAEVGHEPAGRVSATRRWSLDRGAHGASVRRQPGLRFDLDGVAKGWLADRALDIAPGRSAIVDGDGDIAVRAAPGDAWAIGIADPRVDGATLAILELGAGLGAALPVRWGIATSGTSVHRWVHPQGVAHHLIDPRTSRPARTDVVQATVLAGTARAAEALAKVALILGSDAAFEALDRPGVQGVLLLTDRGEIRASAGMVRWLR